MIWRLIPGPIRRALSWLVGAVMFVFVAWHLGKRQGASRANTEAENRQAQGYIKARKRIDEVDISDDIGVLRDSLRARDPNKR